MICECDDVEKIGEALDIVKRSTYKDYVSNTRNIIESIEQYIKTAMMSGDK